MPGERQEALAVDIAHVIGDLFDAGDLEALAHLDRAHEFGRFEQGFVGAGVESRAAAAQLLHHQQLALEMDIVEIGDLKLAARREFQPGRDLDDGPGKAIDTEKLFVVSSNMLGSSFGSTNGASINPDTDKPYGPDFPAITVRDIVAAEKALLDGLGVKHLVAVAGPSYGGYQAFQWAVTCPDLMDAIVPVVIVETVETV
jgi:hypothetical protein